MTVGDAAMDENIKICVFCGKYFIPPKPNVTLCSDYCRKERSRAHVRMHKQRERDELGLPETTVTAKCPLCERTHTVTMAYIGIVRPRIYCDDCRTNKHWTLSMIPVEYAKCGAW